MEIATKKHLRFCAGALSLGLSLGAVFIFITNYNKRDTHNIKPVKESRFEQALKQTTLSKGEFFRTWEEEGGRKERDVNYDGEPDFYIMRKNNDGTYSSAVVLGYNPNKK